MRSRFQKEYDVVIAGGGVAGVAAALAASRNNLKVALVEKTVFWGGLATSGMILIYLPLCDGNGTQVTYGISEELLKASIKYGPGKIPTGWTTGKNLAEEARYRVIFSPASLVLAMDELLQAANVDIWLDTQIIDVKKSGSKIAAVYVANKSGTGELSAKTFVDATGDADLAWFADANCPTGKNALAFWSIQYDKGHTNLSENIALNVWGCSNDPETYGPGISGRMVSSFIMDGRTKYLERLKATYAKGRPREEYYPVVIPSMAQFRHTRRINGEFTLESDMQWREFEDSIGVVADWRVSGKVWEIPYRSLITKDVPNLIAAGRCISSADDAWEVTRVIQAAALTGEAAGLAAVEAASAGCDVLDAKYQQVQQRMVAAGNQVRIKNIYKN